MVLLRRVLGDALRARRQAQHRTLREVSSAANVSLGYLSEVERGQKEASSELLAAICEALGAQLSAVLREVSDMLALAELTTGELTPAELTTAEPPAGPDSTADLPPVELGIGRRPVSVAVHRDGPLKTTLVATRPGAPRETVRAA